MRNEDATEAILKKTRYRQKGKDAFNNKKNLRIRPLKLSLYQISSVNTKGYYKLKELREDEALLDGTFAGSRLKKFYWPSPALRSGAQMDLLFDYLALRKSNRANTQESLSSEARSAVAAVTSRRNAGTGSKPAKGPLALAAAKEAAAIRARRKEEALSTREARARRVFIRRLFAIVLLRKTSSAVLVPLSITVIASIKTMPALTTSAKSYRIEVKTSARRKKCRKRRCTDSQYYR
ncbi:hypothetical protein MBM_06324 [Drepanopeziza brunnea f. sp. 'multigermtubi' MB_m1]|uniref:Uncharacterized protein n=1 Tax=Marssonina brunnea f. sp. multigermtubi (strain MB_m1) TaxID=1072389 RepID=K1WRP9_MARBU|nr:uncharacterized protein MBM_06324 [Drepanopeziza brunnea f. sp. 'multigermtubi' MB_m1]EKD15696.1 hypothetical protein MBM_06324 [Drepanopeziza brunnea f. sp. 'multigermtubi' MB_m1]